MSEIPPLALNTNCTAKMARIVSKYISSLRAGAIELIGLKVNVNAEIVKIFHNI